MVSCQEKSLDKTFPVCSFLEFVDFFTTDLVTGFNKRKTTTPKEKTRKKNPES
jgi:hypothetical protein